MRGNQGDVNFVGLFFVMTANLEGMNDGVGVGEIVAQEGNSPMFGIINWLSDGDNFCHKGVLRERGV